MSANKPQPQKGGQKPKDEEFDKNPQNRDQYQQGGQQKERDTRNTPNNPRGQGSQRGDR